MGAFLPELQGVMETKNKKNKHEIWELRQMQALPLESKITMTKHRIQTWVDEFGVDGVYVSFSGGKDSTVLLHIARQMYPNIEAVFVDVPTQYPELKEFAQTFDNLVILNPKISFAEVCEKHGFPLFSKEIASSVKEARQYFKNIDTRFGKESIIKKYENGDYPIMPAKTKQLLGVFQRKENGIATGEYSKMYDRSKYLFMLDAPFEVSNRCCMVMKKQPAHKYHKDTGRVPITAQMACESKQREAQWIQNGCNSFNAKSPISNPMSFWTEQDVLWYIKENDLQICSVYGDIVIDYDAMGQCENQMMFSDYGIFGEERPLLKTTGCDRTGCVLCGFGCHLEKESRFLRLKETHPKFHNLLHILKNNGVTYAEAIDWINENGNMNIKY